MKKYLFLMPIIILTFIQCATVVRKNHPNIIYESVGVNDVQLGDHQSNIIEMMGEPDDIWVNHFTNEPECYGFRSYIPELKYFNFFEENISDGSFPTLYYNNSNFILDHINFEYSYYYEMNNMYLFFDEFDRVTEIIVYFQTIADSGIDIQISDIHYYLYYLGLVDNENTNSYKYQLKKNKFSTSRSPLFDSILYYNKEGDFTAISIISPVIGSHYATAIYDWPFDDLPEYFIKHWTNENGYQYLRRE